MKKTNILKRNKEIKKRKGKKKKEKKRKKGKGKRKGKEKEKENFLCIPVVLYPAIFFLISVDGTHLFNELPSFLY